ncbi:hypothetical protein RIF29_47020 [Crotalaria pallida]|uniref:Uncharacterized protein n=1 Tax=Crotalaria pallida TaxID=3830 RepID=A0AAN9DUB8_CROPI
MPTRTTTHRERIHKDCMGFYMQTGRDRRLSCLCPLIDMPEVPKLSPLGLSFRKPVRSGGSTETEPSSLADLSVL